VNLRLIIVNMVELDVKTVAMVLAGGLLLYLLREHFLLKDNMRDMTAYLVETYNQVAPRPAVQRPAVRRIAPETLSAVPRATRSAVPSARMNSQLTQAAARRSPVPQPSGDDEDSILGELSGQPVMSGGRR
jgi:hypothetical protein